MIGATRLDNFYSGSYFAFTFLLLQSVGCNACSSLMHMWVGVGVWVCVGVRERDWVNDNSRSYANRKNLPATTLFAHTRARSKLC